MKKRKSWVPASAGCALALAACGLASDTDPAATAWGHAEAADSRGDYALASREMHRAAMLTQGPARANYLLQTGLIAIKAGEGSKALTYARRALTLDPKLAPAALTVAAAGYMLTDELGRAEKSVNRAVELNPDLAVARIIRAEVDLTLADEEKKEDNARLRRNRAVVDLELALDIGAVPAAPVHARLADALEALGKAEDAEAERYYGRNDMLPIPSESSASNRQIRAHFNDRSRPIAPHHSPTVSRRTIAFL